MIRLTLRSHLSTALALLAALLLAAGDAAAATTGAAARPALADLFRNAAFTEVTLSPDGTHLAVTVPEGDRTVLVALKIGTKKPLSRWDFGPRKHIDGVAWVNDKRLIFSVSEKLGSLDQRVGSPDLYASDIDGSRRVAVPNGNTYQILGRVKDSPDHLWAQRSIDQAFLFKLDTRDGSINSVASAPIDSGRFILDHDEKVRYAVGGNSDRKYVVLRREKDGWTKVSETTRDEGGMLTPLAFHPDNKRVYMGGDTTGGPAKLYLLDPESGAKELISENPVSDPVGVVASGDERTMLAVQYEPGRVVTDVIDLDHPEGRAVAGIAKAFPDHSVVFGNASDDGRLRVVRVYSDVDAGSYYLVDQQKGSATYLLSARPWLKPEALATTKPIQFDARDGKRIHGYLTTPRGMPAQRLPMVVFVHGGPHGPRDSWGFDPDLQAMASGGYAVLQVNYRGSGGYGDAFQRAGYRRWGTAMQDDLTDAVRWAAAQGYADIDRVCIYGGSYGGYAALMSPIREPGLYRCAIGYVGVYSLPMMTEKGDIPRREAGRAYLKRVLPEDEAERRAQSPAYNVDKLDLPVMLVHGAKDERVPIDQMEYLVKQMAKAGKKPEMVLVKAKEGHGFVVPENNVELYTKLLGFLDRHLAPRPPKP